jgi:PAS domain S-box-containing protein
VVTLRRLEPGARSREGVGTVFKLIRYFSFTSAIALIVVTAALVVAHRRSAVHELVAMAEAQNAALARSFANTIWPRFSGYVTGVSGTPAEVRARAETRELDAALRALTAGLPVLKVKIYNLDGFTVFSSEPGQIGEDKRNNPGFFGAAREGKLASQLSYRDTFSAFEGTVQNRDLVESYLPVHGGDGAVEAVFELYSDVTPVMRRIQRTTTRLVAGAVLAFGLLYAALFLIVVRADRLIKRQYRELQESEERYRAKNEELRLEVDERTRSEAELRKLSLAVRHSPAMTIVTDSQGRIQYVNPRFSEVTGYRAEEVVGSTPRILSSGKTEPAVYVHLWDTITAGKQWRGELQNRKKGGEEYWVSSSISPIKDAGGAITHFVGVSEDITDRKRSDEALKAAKLEAERANLAKSRFFAAASHDLRQPLHTIALYLPLLSKRVADAKSAEIVDSIATASGAMGDLLDSLLDISKLDAGVVTPNVTVVAVTPLFEKLAREFRVQAEAKGVALRAVAVDAAIETDPVLLERILRNLLTNAVRHTARGKILLGARRRGDRLRIEVWDSGIGIEEGQRERIFQEFYQVGNPERDRAQGLGLGLAIVERLSRLLGHPLRVRSVPGKGSMFSVEVPLARATPQPEVPDMPSGRSSPRDLAGTLVVLVDDDPQVLKGTTALLEEWGCSVIAAETIGSALTRIDQSTRAPDLILADLRLRGEETGVMAIQLINQFAGCRAPAAIITGDTDPERIREATRSGYPTLHKPVDVAELRALVEERLGWPRRRSA